MMTVMKRYVCYLLIAAAAVVAACQKESVKEEDSIIPDEQPTPEVQKSTYTYTVDAYTGMDDLTGDKVAVKSDYDGEGNFKWSAGDAISVLFHDASKEDSDPDKNKFFTLTLTSGAGYASASFSGEITSGYTIGASDGDAVDKKIWALFPASTSHTYTVGSTYPSFYVQPSVDFSATHFSANVPMYALNAAEGSLSFTNLASTYKFIVSNIKDGVSKVRFTIYNQTTFGLSGLWPIANDGKLIVNYGYASSGSAKSTLTYVSNVTSNQAVFYVSCHGTYGEFKPNITVTNADTGVAIKSFVASKTIIPNTVTTIQPITLNVSEASGGVYYTPAITIDGDLSDWDGISALPSSQTSRIREWKFKSDAYYVYFYFSLRKNRCGTGKPLAIGFNTDNDTATGSNYDTNKILGNETTVTATPFTNAVESELIPVNDFDASSSASIYGGSTTKGVVYVYNYDAGEPLGSDSSSTYIELSIPRDKLNLPAAGNTITIGCAFDYYVTGTQSITLE